MQRRRDIFSPTYKYKYKKRRDWIIFISLIIVGFLIYSLIKLSKGYYCIYVDELPVSCLKEKKEAEEIIDRILIKKASYLKDKAQFVEKIEIKKDRGIKKELIDDKEKAKMKLLPRVNVIIKACGIEVNNKEMVIVRDEKVAKLILERLKKELLPKDTSELKNIRFKQKIKINNVTVKFDEIQDIDVAIKNLKKETGKAIYHIVKKGEIGKEIAGKYGITLSRLKALNPSVKLDRLHIGQRLKISSPKSSITILAEKVIVKKNEIPFTTKIIHNKRWPKGKEEVIRKGKNGISEQKILIRYENGVVEERIVTKEKIIKQPVQQIVMRGIE